MLLTDENGSKEFKQKPQAVKNLINEALWLIEACGVPTNDTPRRLERMAMALLAVADVPTSGQWYQAKGLADGRSMKTRDIIAYVNSHFGENISPGSYDDIRRQDLLLLVEHGIVVQTVPQSARNAPNRGYAINEHVLEFLRSVRPDEWQDVELERLPSDLLGGIVQAEEVEVTLPGGKVLCLSPGEHNLLQKAISEDFLRRFAPDAQILYIGDTAKKLLHLETEALDALNCFELSHGELPDIIAYSPSKNWLYLIEAVHSAGPISPIRKAKLSRLLEQCTAGLIYVTAFLDFKTFRTWLPKIAWETEVWIAEEPDHLIHFDGERFLGPY